MSSGKESILVLVTKAKRYWSPEERLVGTVVIGPATAEVAATTSNTVHMASNAQGRLLKMALPPIESSMKVTDIMCHYISIIIGGAV